MKFLIDMPLSPAVATWLVSQGHDAVHASSVGLHAAADSTILSRAHSEGRVIVTADLDYPRLLALEKMRRPGVILLRGGDFDDGEAVERIGSVLTAYSEQQIAVSIIVAERSRIRRRELPIQSES
jgi:predicted nuclease of predicted toxin-antitoxin system